MPKKTKLELTWIGKDKPLKLEPRILIEDPEKSYGDSDSENMLIHGDNLLALKALEQNYTGKVKCIYIDPPYNTGSAFEHYDDGVEHSIWLNLMHHRLEILKNLLTEDGVVWISIDDNECHYLKVLLDSIFGRSNFIACLPTIMNLKGNQDQLGFAGTHEYTLVYAKNKDIVKFNNFPIDEEELLEWKEDEISLYKKGATMKATGEDAFREKRPKMFFPILVSKEDEVVTTITQIEYEKIYNSSTKEFNDSYVLELEKIYTPNFHFILPKDDKGNFTRWRWGWNPNTIKKLETDVIVITTKKGISLYKKQRPELGELPTKKPKSVFYKPTYSSGNGTSQIKKIFGKKSFDYPKPEELISDIIHISSSPGDFVLDSFLGSGTTAAVAQKMGRNWIGIELGDHAYTHCKVRMDKVIDGTDQGGISKTVNWKDGGGYKFYELASSLLTKDKHGNFVIDTIYNAEMLASAMAKQESFKYAPDQDFYWKQGQSTENDYIYTTTQFMTVEALDRVHAEMKKQESLLICCKSFDSTCKQKYPNITLKKIPQMLLGRCEFGKEDYSLNIINVPGMEDQEIADGFEDAA